MSDRGRELGRERQLEAVGLGGRLLEGPGAELVASAGRLEAADAPILDPGLNAADIGHAMTMALSPARRGRGRWSMAAVCTSA